MSDLWQTTSDRKGTWPGAARSGHASCVTRHAPAFTLIEIMIVVAIIGLIAAMGVPSIFQAFRKEGMRRAVGDVRELLGNARARAIYTGQATQVVFQPAKKRLDISGASLIGTPANDSGSTPLPSALSGAQGSVVLPDSVDIAMLDVDMLDRGGDETASVAFYPDGTCQELTLILHCGDEWQKITLEFSTSLALVGPVTR